MLVAGPGSRAARRSGDASSRSRASTNRAAATRWRATWDRSDSPAARSPRAGAAHLGGDPPTRIARPRNRWWAWRSNARRGRVDAWRRRYGSRPNLVLHVDAPRGPLDPAASCAVDRASRFPPRPRWSSCAGTRAAGLLRADFLSEARVTAARHEAHARSSRPSSRAISIRTSRRPTVTSRARSARSRPNATAAERRGARAEWRVPRGSGRDVTVTSLGRTLASRFGVSVGAQAPRGARSARSPDTRPRIARVISTPRAAPETGTTLVRAIGVRGLAAGLFNTIVSAGIFVLPATVAGLVDRGALYAILACAIAILFVTLCYAAAGSRVIEAGGSYAAHRQGVRAARRVSRRVMVWLGDLLATSRRRVGIHGQCRALCPALDSTRGARRVHHGRRGRTGRDQRARREAGLRFMEFVTIARLAPLVLFIGIRSGPAEPQPGAAGGADR